MQEELSVLVDDVYQAIGHAPDELFCEVDGQGCCCRVSHCGCE